MQADRTQIRSAFFMADPLQRLAALVKRCYPHRQIVGVLHRTEQSTENPFAKYRNDPVGFARDVLGVELTEDQATIARAFPGRVKVNSGHNIGKAQPLDLLIDTPDGRRAFGSLKVGDLVFGVDGAPTRVVALHPRAVQSQYRVTFDDHTSTLVSGGHLWTVRGRRQRRSGGKWITLSTEELLKRGVRRPNGRATARVWELPRIGPVQYAGRDVPVPPYTMGQWLGNGTVGTPNITSADPEVPGWIAEETGCEVRIRSDGSKAFTIVPIGLKAAFRAAGVIDTPTDQKRVPRQYLENDAAVRLAVLQGLMDTDGTASELGVATFCSTSRGLAEDVAWLVRSLGGKAYIQPTTKKPFYYSPDGERIDCKPAHQVTVVLPELSLFRLTRKQSRVRTHGRTGWAARMIESIEPAGEAEMRCITVEAPDGLYLTNDFIPTHNSFLAAVLALWWYCTRNPSVVVVTAPTQHDIDTILWTEIRLLYLRARIPIPGKMSPRASLLFDDPDHWAEGYTAAKGESFQGRHRESMLFIFDESEGLEPIYWETTSTMFQPDQDHAWLAIGNPTTTSSQSYLEDMALAPDGSPKWKVFSLSALTHPNIKAQLEGRPIVVPNAVTLGQVEQWLADWAQRIDAAEREVTDVEWPPGSTIWYRPGPNFKSRVMGVRPTEGIDTVWSLQAWTLATTPRWSPQEVWLRKSGITIGIDPAAYGDDDTSIHVRSGPLSLHHEWHNGWGPGQTAGRTKELMSTWVTWYNRHAVHPDRPPLTVHDVDVVIEFDGGYGVGVHSHRGEFTRWRGVSAGSASQLVDPNGRYMYFDKRSELWFNAAGKAKGGMMDLSRLPAEVQARLKMQLLAAYYEVTPNRGRRVEPKDEMKERMKRSPDDADALNICHYDSVSQLPSVIGRPDDAAVPTYAGLGRSRR